MLPPTTEKRSPEFRSVKPYALQLGRLTLLRMITRVNEPRHARDPAARITPGVTPLHGLIPGGLGRTAKVSKFIESVLNYEGEYC